MLETQDKIDLINSTDITVGIGVMLVINGQR